ncbi:MAG TPA: hypothetical protein VFE88_01515 [Candidatus Nanoarchaeia archaeon]|nr:hypothetical protein [Candidatus Nanoarchaeia archaeon]
MRKRKKRENNNLQWVKRAYMWMRYVVKHPKTLLVLQDCAKKGQFFIVAAVIVIMVFFTVVAQYNTIKVHVALEDFDELSEQYASEQPIVINEALFGGDSPEAELARFTDRFMDYTSERQPEFGGFYAVTSPDGSVVTIRNFLAGGQSMELTAEGASGNRIPFPSGDTTIRLISTAQQSEGTLTLNIGTFRTGITLSAPITAYGDVGQTSIRGAERLIITIPGNPEPIRISTPQTGSSGFTSASSGEIVRARIFE